MTRHFIAPALLGVSLLLSACGGSDSHGGLLPLIPPTTNPLAVEAPKNILFFLGDGIDRKSVV